MLSILADDFSPFPFREEIKKATEAHRPSVLLVPEQLALSAERSASDFLPAHAPLCFEVSNFSRLADRAFRTLGGISYRYADRAAQALLMWKTLDAAAPFLTTKKAFASADGVKEKLSAMNELTASGLSPADLRRAAAKAEENEPLRDKLSDLALIMEIYEGETRQLYGSHAADLDKLLAILKEHALFADTEFFVFGFTSFTAKELFILGELARHSLVHISLPLPDEDERALCYEETKETLQALMALASRIGVPTERKRAPREVRPAPLAYAKARLFRADGDKTPYAGGQTEALHLITATDPFDGAEHIAAMIAKAVREQGARYRDFTIFTRAPEKYDGILDAALTSQGIPYFFSVPTALPELSLCKMILSAYACIHHSYRRADLISYMKSGFSGIACDDCDAFELYCSFWNVQGRAFAEDTPFDMHPRGYESSFTAEDEERLLLVNRVRTVLLSPLWSLEREAGKRQSAREHATALFHFLRALGTEEALLAAAQRERKEGRVAESERLSRLSGVICDLLDVLCDVMGELPISSERFAELLSLLFSSVSLGTLPTSQDAVTVGDADSIRPSDVKTAFLFGANEGEFPAAVGAQGAFLEEERRALSSLGITVGKDIAVRASREQFSFLRALCTPEKQAVVLAFESNAMGASLRPSSVFDRLCRLFPGCVREMIAPPELFTLRAAREHFAELRGTQEGEALAALLQESGTSVRALEASRIPIFDPVCRIEDELASALFPERLYTSQSKIEKFLDCPFAYFCKYVLSIPEDKKAVIGSSIIGSTMHAILERFFDFLEEDGVTVRTVDSAKIPLYIERACAEYLEKTCPPSMQSIPRLTHIFARLRRAASLVAKDICEEFAHSAFTPRFCELKIGEHDTPEALLLKDKDGKSVRIGGVIDRVDTYRSPEGELFVRVVDYKSNARKFSREELRRGRNIQMFVYLCAIWKSENEAFLSRLSLKPGESPIPAGIVYSTSSPAVSTQKAPMDAEHLEEQAARNLTREGFFLKEDAILQAMDDTISGKIVPVTRLKSGALSYKKGSFGVLEEFGEMLDETEEALCSVARRMREGIADIEPDKEKSTSPCNYCAFHSVCRADR